MWAVETETMEIYEAEALSLENNTTLVHTELRTDGGTRVGTGEILN